ncbi:hypothetical protein RCL1_007060 [Eukaryota sp. TZLM3-RCL]
MSSKDFKILSKLGAGAFGTTFKAQHKRTKEIYCLKRINVSSSDNSKSAEAEIAILSTLPFSPHVVKYFSYYKHSDCVDILMSYANEGSLDSYTLKNRSSTTTGLPFDDVVNLSLQISQGVKFLHSNSIIHRDINPRNILIHQKSTNTEVWICDFGISKLVNKDLLATSMVGSHYYVAPEVLSRAPYTNVCDLFSLGVVICFICTGTVPFASQMDWIMGSFEPLTGDYAKLNDLVKNLIVSHPNSRWSIDQVIDFLESIPQKPLNRNFSTHTGTSHTLTVNVPKPLQSKDLIDVKVVFLTSQGSDNGATTLIHRLAYDEFIADSNTTIGAAFTSVKLSPYKLHIWDTAALHLFQSVVNIYLRTANIAVLCFRRHCGPKSLNLLEEDLIVIRNTHKGVLLLVLTIIDVTDSYPPVDNCEGFDQLLQQFLVTSVFKVSSKTNEGVPEFKQSLLQYCEAFNPVIEHPDESTFITPESKSCSIM